MILNILTYPNNFLRGKNRILRDILSTETQTFIENLKETMLVKDGVGLAARQVGNEDQIFVVQIDKNIEVFINAKIVYSSFIKSELEEGCLSVPDVYGLVSRPKTILVKYYNQIGQLKIKRFSNLIAHVVQHEYDHNQGVLFIDKVKELTHGIIPQ
ncbi:MAG: peptide deformylase [Candidatus Komeilibacteria bacterium CG_4_10_14_0_2_um_filter_37_10]|uniref:Peptide deformylase n=1 Tax=Candidatus Komeilibacteria bacterium CG_4_10_14_0_2_um_filter_37_10 TaxID=1974470 RepID=A0A2M7VDV5_9BACT|nr:MAG: peptide deformylase [Candidatus Komeilibacteria bacterium CG_4_10_14_0_2_um_filter_37_10]PJA93771.1 MAG: peptide deformylase [Candidatus Komeilibacteria bacterium CG_4_9_14_3_um_filter_37_5]